MHLFASCVFISLLKRHAPVSSATDSLPFTEKDGKDDFDLSFITPLEDDVIPCLCHNRVHEYLIIQLAKVLEQDSRILQYEQDHGHSPTPGNPAQPKTRSAARSSEADTAGQHGTHRGGLEGTVLPLVSQFTLSHSL